ncbi:MAG: nuclear transport factor 2 family protein [Jatrophihabitans sp.]
MTSTPETVVARYFDAWQGGDATSLRSLVTDDVTFAGPMGTVDNADEFVTSLQKLREMMTGLTVLHRFVDGDDVLTWYEMQVPEKSSIPVAHWAHVESGKVASLRVTFDPRPILG